MHKNKLPPKFSATRYHKSESKLRTVLAGFLLKKYKILCSIFKETVKNGPYRKPNRELIYAALHV